MSSTDRHPEVSTAGAQNETGPGGGDRARRGGDEDGLGHRDLKQGADRAAREKGTIRSQFGP
jgi:hypothetical protein